MIKKNTKTDRYALPYFNYTCINLSIIYLKDTTQVLMCQFIFLINLGLIRDRKINN